MEKKTALRLSSTTLLALVLMRETHSSTDFSISLMNTVVCQYPNTAYKKCAGELFTRACSDKRRGKGFKLTQGRRFRFYIRKKLSAVRMVRQVAQRSCR